MNTLLKPIAIGVAVIIACFVVLAALRYHTSRNPEVISSSLSLPANHKLELVQASSGVVQFGKPSREIGYQQDILYRSQHCNEFWISRFEITNLEFLAFYHSEEFWKSQDWQDFEDSDRVFIRKKLDKLDIDCQQDQILLNHPYRLKYFSEAKAWVHWCSSYTGKNVQLPSAIEWEYAAEGSTRSGQIKLFPWGDRGLFNSVDSLDMKSCNSGFKFDEYERLAPIGLFPLDVSWCGAQDMAGNVSEVTDTYFDSTNVMVKGGSYIIGKSLDFKTMGNTYGELFTCSANVPRSVEQLGTATGFRIIVHDNVNAEKKQPNT